MAKDYEFKVNGEQLSSERQVQTAHWILELAREKGAIPGPPDSYILKASKGDYKGTDSVDLAEDSLFITVPNTSTTVATDTPIDDGQY